MSIDFKKTQELCKVLNYAALAREFNLTRSAVQLIVSGKYRSMKTPNALAVLARIRSMGLLVEVPDHDESMAA